MRKGWAVLALGCAVLALRVLSGAVLACPCPVLCCASVSGAVLF